MHRLFKPLTTSSTSLPRVFMRSMSSSFTILEVPSRPRTIFEAGNSPASIRKYLIAEQVEMKDGSQIHPRNVKGAHFTCVLPEPVPNPYPVAYSKSLAEELAITSNSLDLKPSVGEVQDKKTNNEAASLLQVLAGNRQVVGFDFPLCTVYGCHSYGHWFGQLGDGRAILIGEVVGKHTSDTMRDAKDSLFQKTRTRLQQEALAKLQVAVPLENIDDSSLHLRELQLKGSGRSPYSRGFDGRAVLRSSVREYLASEAMYHLAVPTTRALSLITTGQTIRRAWYASTSSENPYVDPNDSKAAASNTRPFPPDVLLGEPGSIVCRVARSFLRIGQLELFAKRQEWTELSQLLDYACLREFPHLLGNPKQQEQGADGKVYLPDEIPHGNADRYIELYRHIAHNTAYLVNQWIRVGYIQGNMNSDNTLISGTTLDYGPFSFMEKFEPFYTPFTSDTASRGGFLRQGEVMALNIAVLGETVFVPLMRQVMPDPYSQVTQRKIEEIQKIAEIEFPTFHGLYYQDIQVRKLGFQYSEEDIEKIEKLWSDVLTLMYRSQCDYTIFFRELANINTVINTENDEELNEVLYTTLESAFYSNIQEMELKLADEWIAWIKSYVQLVQKQSLPPETRKAIMQQANPKYILRNWMSMLAYEKAEEGDYSIVHELETLLQNPYDDHNLGTCEKELEKKYYNKTPDWARRLPGVTFMS